MGNRSIPHRDQLRDYNHAVAGHAGTMCDVDGELFIKPCTQAEIDFYESANRRHPEFAELMPLFLGTLMLSDPADVRIEDAVAGVISENGDLETAKEHIAAAVAEQIVHSSATTPGSSSTDNGAWVPTQGKKIKTDKAVVLENASHGFKKANILDAKLGVRLWADDAPEEKKTRFDQIAAATTHGSLGFRIAGMKAYHGSDDESAWDEEGYQIYDKNYGRDLVNDDNVVDAFRKFVFNKAAGIDQALGRAVCAAFAQDLQRVQDVMRKHHSRMYSASVLFVFEGDGFALRQAIEENNAIAEFVPTKPVDRSTSRVDSGIALEDESISGDDTDNDSISALPRIYQLKLIDFAHARWTPELGPDENILKGIKSLQNIFEELAQ